MISKLEEQTSKGVFWNFLEKFLSRGIGVLVTLLLAWFLVPEDYALVAMVAVFIMLSKVIVDGGLGQALIRKTDTNDIDNNTVFYTNIFLSIIIYIMLYFLAPLIAEFYDQKILKDIIRVVGITVFFNAFIVVQQALLQKNMLFKLQLRIHLPAAIISGISALLLADW
jgi:O-antigen/teichoic acid export membrane protein